MNGNKLFALFMIVGLVFFNFGLIAGRWASADSFEWHGIDILLVPLVLFIIFKFWKYRSFFVSE